MYWRSLARIGVCEVLSFLCGMKIDFIKNVQGGGEHGTVLTSKVFMSVLWLMVDCLKCLGSKFY